MDAGQSGSETAEFIRNRRAGFAIFYAKLNQERIDIVDTFIAHAFSVFMGFFAIMNPIANTSVFWDSLQTTIPMHGARSPPRR